MTVLSAVVLCLLAAQACQPRRVHVQDLRSIESRKLSEKGNNLLALEEDVADIYSTLPVVLQRCLADPACTDALAAAVVDERDPQQNNGRPSTHTDKILAFTSLAQEQKQEQRRQQHGYSMSFASFTSDNPAHGGDGLGTVQTEGDGRSGSGNEDIPHSSGGAGDGINSNGMALGHGGNGGNDEDDSADEQASISLKGLVALVLFLEAVAGMYLPLLLQRLQSPQWWLSLLNCFSGGIFLSAGIIHLLPHCAEAQEALGPIGPGGDYPLYLVLVVVGYCVVFYVERVLFDVHGEGHAHCQHSNVYSHSSYYKAISHHRSQRIPRTRSGSAGTEPAPLLLPAPGAAGAGPGHPGRAAEAPGCTHSSKMDREGQAAMRAAAEEPLVAREESCALYCHDHGHQHSNQHVSHSQGHQHLGSRLSLQVDEGEEGAAFALPVGADSAGARMAGKGVGEDDDAESCHSDHPPRAVCVCVEEQEAEAEERGQYHHNHSHNHSHNSHTHKHEQKHQQHQHVHKARGDRQQIHDLANQAHGQGRRGSAGGGCTGSSGGGEFGGDQLRVPLLLAEQGAPKLPTPVLDNASGNFAIAPNADGGGDSVDLRALAWQHLQARHCVGQSPQLPFHPPEPCAYHTHHHLHPHHRHRRRSAGTGPPVGSYGSGGGAGAMDSGASSCTSPSHHHHHHTAPTGHHTHHDHHHVIKPRFRFMHGVVLLVALALHTALECIALGLIDSRAQFLLLFAAIASHKAVSALALSSRFLREGATLLQVTAYVGPFCLVAPVSVLVGLYIGRVAPIARLVFSCFATGTFFYVGASEVIMEEFEGEMRADRRDISTRAARYIKFFAVLAAVALVAASGLLPEPDHH
ncbi:hypothetical protein VOLCADRAFT_89649 [Volvox carteri f. nagariensis]|uniref:ZIP family transporter n=1 Tax=Volvox carteri f. nagariensis TaxID=3068 RepID=D8TSE6_VOLCA|nr:uncharacterized protein VOLCADRAFT_89649 [Volvox carteri f. nagariensis]EFJ49683.1 hypothetical protein VOLCADRAFT_89649 [Volvox carteri f. nagariensis]|eukprot:XP_002949190.1 hypothetical protein VOLCADRAFT_89649 [Volvox carteri f. nagariensis]